MKLIIMTQVIEKYSYDNLDLSLNTDQDFFTYYRSSREPESNAKEKEALSKLKTVKHPDSIVSGGDWEQLIIDNVN